MVMRCGHGQLLTSVGLALLPAVALGHGALQLPPSWHNPGGVFSAFLQPGQAQQPGAGDQNAQGCTGKHAPGQLEAAQGCAAEWYTNYTATNPGQPGSWEGPIGKGEPTISRFSPLRTYQDWNFVTNKPCTSKNDPECTDWTAANPWRAPGTAPVWSPCGIDGGNPFGCPFGAKTPDGCAGGGYAFGPDARNFTFHDVVKTSWKAGSVQSVAWGITANHGGGYAYRLCKKGPGGNMALSEECFEKTHLTFVGNESLAIGCNDKLSASRAKPCNSILNYSFPALRTSDGTWPRGSQWTRNPIPACSGPGGGAPAVGGVCDGTQFSPPFPGGFGFGNGASYTETMYFSIVDKVQVPSELEKGEYALSFRYDCEQTSQVWNQCADVVIV